MEKNKKTLLIVIITIIIILGVWGLIGGYQASKVTNTCDIGLADDFLCWKWHKNIFGDIADIGEEISEEVTKIFSK